MSEYVKSPLNYMGGKYKILDQIIPLFPEGIGTFVDLFGGGFNVGANVPAEKTVYNDVVKPLCDLMSYFLSHSLDEVVSALEKNIERYGLSKTDEEAFRAVRDRYNFHEYEDADEKALDFYTVILYGFNYQIRFNRDMKFNTPFGKNRSSFNASIKSNLVRFVDRLHEMNVEISSLPFSEVDLSMLGSCDMVYCDPPYLITTGCYNDGNRGVKEWTEDDMELLLKTLDSLDSRGVRFALSDAFRANGKSNDALLEWAEKYDTHIINNTFNNSNYHRKYKSDLTEVLVTNF